MANPPDRGAQSARLVQALTRVAAGGGAVVLGVVAAVFVARALENEAARVGGILIVTFLASMVVIWAATKRLTGGGIAAFALLATGGVVVVWEVLAHSLGPLAVFGLQRAVLLAKLTDLVFYLLAGAVVAGAVGVAVSRNIIYSALALLASLLGVAGLYIYLSADFLAVTQLLIYVGGILVLILFAIMLTNQLGEDPQVTNASIGLPAGAGLGLVTIGALAYMAIGTPWRVLPADKLTFATTGAALGDAFLLEYLLPFEIASVILLCALIGAVVIARKDLKEVPEHEREEQEAHARKKAAAA